MSTVCTAGENVIECSHKLTKQSKAENVYILWFRNSTSFYAAPKAWTCVQEDWCKDVLCNKVILTIKKKSIMLQMQ